MAALPVVPHSSFVPRTTEGQHIPVTAALSPSGGYFAVGCQDGTVLVYQSVTDQLVRAYNVFADPALFGRRHTSPQQKRRSGVVPQDGSRGGQAVYPSPGPASKEPTTKKAPLEASDPQPEEALNPATTVVTLIWGPDTQSLIVANARADIKWIALDPDTSIVSLSRGKASHYVNPFCDVLASVSLRASLNNDTLLLSALSPMRFFLTNARVPESALITRVALLATCVSSLPWPRTTFLIVDLGFDACRVSTTLTDSIYDVFQGACGFSRQFSWNNTDDARESTEGDTDADNGEDEVETAGPVGHTRVAGGASSADNMDRTRRPEEASEAHDGAKMAKKEAGEDGGTNGTRKSNEVDEIDGIDEIADNPDPADPVDAVDITSTVSNATNTTNTTKQPRAPSRKSTNGKTQRRRQTSSSSARAKRRRSTRAPSRAKSRRAPPRPPRVPSPRQPSPESSDVTTSAGPSEAPTRSAREVRAREYDPLARMGVLPLDGEHVACSTGDILLLLTRCATDGGDNWVLTGVMELDIESGTRRAKGRRPLPPAIARIMKSPPFWFYAACQPGTVLPLLKERPLMYTGQTYSIYVPGQKGSFLSLRECLEWLRAEEAPDLVIPEKVEEPVRPSAKLLTCAVPDHTLVSIFISCDSPFDESSLEDDSALLLRLGISQAAVDRIAEQRRAVAHRGVLVAAQPFPAAEMKFMPPRDPEAISSRFSPPVAVVYEHRSVKTLGADQLFADRANATPGGSDDREPERRVRTRNRSRQSRLAGRIQNVDQAELQDPSALAPETLAIYTNSDATAFVVASPWEFTVYCGCPLEAHKVVYRSLVFLEAIDIREVASGEFVAIAVGMFPKRLEGGKLGSQMERSVAYFCPQPVQRYDAFCPNFVTLSNNVLYVEREDEYDLETDPMLYPPTFPKRLVDNKITSRVLGPGCPYESSESSEPPASERRENGAGNGDGDGNSTNTKGDGGENDRDIDLDVFSPLPTGEPRPELQHGLPEEQRIVADFFAASLASLDVLAIRKK